MKALAVFLVFALFCCTHAAAPSPWWSSKVISFWYAPDANWADALDIVSAHPQLVTSVMLYCGLDVSNNGTIITTFDVTCASLIPRMQALGVRAELATNAGNCDINAYRTLWADTAISPGVLRDAVLFANVSGLNIDFEPQADNCKGGPTGTIEDAVLFSKWLSAVRAELQPHGIRLTVDVAEWSPVLRQYATLAMGVDRLLNMETYNKNSKEEWEGVFNDYISKTPLVSAGVGLGAWSEGKGAWWETSDAAAFKVKSALASQIPELAVFRILPKKEVDPEWPLAFWWDALKQFVAV